MKIFMECMILTLFLASCGGGNEGSKQDDPPTVSNPMPADGAMVSAGSAQVLLVYAPGATSGIFYYDDTPTIAHSVAATVNGDYLRVAIQYGDGEGQISKNGPSYWYVEATNSIGTARYPATGQLFFTVLSVPAVSSPNPSNGATVSAGTNGQVLQVNAPGATSGIFHYDDALTMAHSVAATVNGDSLEVTIPYGAGQMNINGTNYWYVEATNVIGTTRYPASGQLSFTVLSAPAVSLPNPPNGATVTPGSRGQVLKVYAPGATSGTFYYDGDSVIDNSVAATVYGDYLEVTIPYSAGQMNNNGTNYWYVLATNTTGTTQYPDTGQLSFTVSASGFSPSTWYVSYNWDCSLSYKSTYWYLDSDNTFTESLGSGTWSLLGSAFKLVYASPGDAVYTGTVSGNFMSGTMTSINLMRSGCWKANWYSNTIP